MNFDYFLFQQLNYFAGQGCWIDKAIIFFASYFQYFLAGGVLVLLFLNKDIDNRKQNRIMVPLAFLSAIIARYIFTDLIRWFYYRPRPFVDHQVIQLINHDATGSLPSGHAAFFFALATLIYLYSKKIYPEYSYKIGWLFFSGASLISLARVFAGVHYPLDILAGAAVGIFSGWLVIKIFQGIKEAP